MFFCFSMFRKGVQSNYQSRSSIIKNLIIFLLFKNTSCTIELKPCERQQKCLASYLQISLCKVSSTNIFQHQTICFKTKDLKNATFSWQTDYKANNLPDGYSSGLTSIHCVVSLDFFIRFIYRHKKDSDRSCFIVNTTSLICLFFI